METVIGPRGIDSGNFCTHPLSKGSYYFLTHLLTKSLLLSPIRTIRNVPPTSVRLAAKKAANLFLFSSFLSATRSAERV